MSKLCTREKNICIYIHLKKKFQNNKRVDKLGCFIYGCRLGLDKTNKTRREYKNAKFEK